MPLQATSGAASYDAFGGGVPVVPKYIEDYFSTFLYSGNAGTQTVTNGIDLSTKGGMVWIKSRSGAYPHSILDTARGFNYSGTQTKRLDPSTTDSQADAAGNATQASSLTDGFSVTTSGGGAINFYNASGQTYTSWSFAKAPKFFDVLTYTGTGSTRTVAHNLGSVPGCIMIKNLSDTDGWLVYHRGIGATKTLTLNSTGAAVTDGIDYFNDTEPTSTVFTVKEGGKANASGNNYVAYLFAHNAGGFGLTGTDNVISCGSFTTDGSGNATVSLGYEPQWLLTKGTSAGNDWFINDNMRGLSYSTFAFLNPNYSDAETVLSGDYLVPNATGFTAKGFSGSTTFIYIAIRRGPMKVPTSGTSVFSPQAYTGTGAARTIDTSQTFLDSYIVRRRPGDGDNTNWLGRLTGSNALQTNATNAEGSIGSINWASQDLAFTGANYNTNNSSQDYVAWTFQRAPSFFDEVCYTGTGSARTLTHNLGVVPELMIVKRRSASSFNGWPVYVPTSTAPRTNVCLLNTTASAADSSYFNLTAPTSTVFSVDDHQDVNASGNTYVAYLFATCAGVSKVGSYTGTGTTKQIDCGFTAGARFVLIKKTSGTGSWYVWDSARGIVSGNDPYLLLNSTAAEVTNTDYIDTYSAGFEISSTAPSEINENGGSFIFLAIA